MFKPKNMRMLTVVALLGSVLLSHGIGRGWYINNANIGEKNVLSVLLLLRSRGRRASNSSDSSDFLAGSFGGVAVPVKVLLDSEDGQSSTSLWQPLYSGRFDLSLRPEPDRFQNLAGRRLCRTRRKRYNNVVQRSKKISTRL
jgi:hypothetical protein